MGPARVHYGFDHLDYHAAAKDGGFRFAVLGDRGTEFSKHGIELVDCHLISNASKPFIDENLLLPILFTFC